MTDYQAPYTVTPEILNRVAAFSEAIGWLTVTISTPQVDELLAVIQREMNREALQAALGLSDHKSFLERYLQPALADGLIAMTIPDKPNSRLQKYRLTDIGRSHLANIRSPHHTDNNLKPKE